MSRISNNDFDLQEFIYELNKSRLRTSIIKSSISSYKDDHPIIWMGTFTFREKHNNNTVIKNIVNKIEKYQGKMCICLFTCCYIYDGNRIHYISVIYESATEHVIIFDSGFNLYPVGKTFLIPIMKNIFKSLSNTILFFNKTVCPSTNYGVQLKIQTKKQVIPDAFCQSWSLFFIQCYVRSGGKSDFFKSWCQIKPALRDYFLFENFIIPTIVSQKYLRIKYDRLLIYLQDLIYQKIWFKK